MVGATIADVSFWEDVQVRGKLCKEIYRGTKRDTERDRMREAVRDRMRETE